MSENGVYDRSCLYDEATIKIPIVWDSESFQVVEHINTGRVIHPNSTGTEAPVLRTLSHISLCISSSGRSSVSFNKLVNISKCFPEFFELLQQINQTQGGGCGRPQFVEVVGNLGTYYLQLASEVGWESSCGTVPLICEI